MSRKNPIRVWMLSLVPNVRFGRWISAAIILSLGLGIYALAVWMAGRPGAPPRQYINWPVAIFFVCAVAYIVPVFHYINARTKQAVEALVPHLKDRDSVEYYRHAVEHKPLAWSVRVIIVAIALWLIQSRLLAGGWVRMWDHMTSGLLNFTMDWGPLPVWLTMTTAMSALFQNAILFRRLSQALDIQILEPDSYLPIGSMAITSTLVALGGLALLSIMWLGGPVSWWTTLPAIGIFSPLIAALLLMPVLPVRRTLIAQRQAALTHAQSSLREATQHDDLQAQTSALVLRRELMRLPTWPFDVPAITRFISYAVIVPLTWAGAALIEMLVNALVG